MPQKDEFYRRIKLAGLISFIPVVLITGPLACFFFAKLILKEFKLPNYWLFICVSLGLIAAAMEIVRIIKLVVNINKKD